jgi:hypothetical protein
MTTVRVKLKSGNNEIEVEGSKTEVDQLLDHWWFRLAGDQEPLSPSPKDPSPRKPRQSARSPDTKKTNGKSGDKKIDAVQLANSVKERGDFKSLQKHVLHKKDMYNKIALICLQADDHLTSGDITRVFRELDLKGSLGNVSTCLKTNSAKFVTTGSRKAGGEIARYKLTSHAKAEFEEWLTNAEK